jgi:DNA (cytosine-5)-methyltransferase 1
VQTFPDSHVFQYTAVSDGYKMVGNAVPVELARRIAEQIEQDMREKTGTKLGGAPLPGAIQQY